jgi:hypothetical protein
MAENERIPPPLSQTPYTRLARAGSLAVAVGATRPGAAGRRFAAASTPATATTTWASALCS